jgi:hypothetical protein
LNTIWKALVEEGGKGVKKEDFQRLKVQIGVARERVKDAERKKRREEREAEIEEIKENLKKKIEAVDKSCNEVEEVVKQVEEDSKTLHSQIKDLNSVEMVKRADEIEEKTKEAKTQAEEMKGKITAVREDVDEDVLVWLNTQVRPVEGKTARFLPRLEKISQAAQRLRESAKWKEREELVTFEKRAVAMIKYHQKKKDLSNEDVFSELSKKADHITKANFLKFFEKCEKEPTDESDEKKKAPPALSVEDLTRLFTYLDDEAQGRVSKEKMLSLIRVIFKVVKDTVLSDGVDIKESQTLRRLETGEALEALGFEEKNEEADVTRVKVKALKDDKEGWVTICGNQGTIFLREGGKLYKVVKETILTESFELSDDSAKDNARKLTDTTRKLRPGEVVEVRVWMKKEEKSGLMRMRCKAKTDGAIGWATVVGNQGTVFLESLAA